MNPFVGASCLLVTAVALVGAGPASVLSQPRGERPEAVLRGEKYWIGRFDADGNFIRHPEHQAYSAMPLRLAVPRTFGGNVAVYEHRSQPLIQGTMADQPYGVFVPEIGSTVLDLRKDFDPTKPDRLVWNMPVITAAFWTPERMK